MYIIIYFLIRTGQNKKYFCLYKIKELMILTSQ